jgi:hypothetical protein
MSSAEYPPYTNFEPYQYITNKSNTLDHFFFDGIACSDSSFCFVISNNYELSTWQYNNNGWSKGEAIAMQVADYFSLCTHKNRPYLILSDGSIYAIMNNQLMKEPEKKLDVKLSDIILIIDKMKDTIFFINAASFNEERSIEELMKNAVPVFQ